MNAEFLDHMGDDLAVVNAAKISFSRDSKELTEKDKSLIYFLARGCPREEWENALSEIMGMEFFEDVEEEILKIKHMATHWTPFTHTAIKFKVNAPIPIRTQCFKHKIGFTENEESRRYIKSTPVVHIPDYFRSSAKNVKQGSTKTPHPDSDKWMARYAEICGAAINAYMDMTKNEVDEDGKVTKYGVCPEQARFILPQGTEVNWIWTGNLAAFARYYNQRTDSHAQLESQELAKVIGDQIAPLFPVSWEALTGKGKKYDVSEY